MQSIQLVTALVLAPILYLICLRAPGHLGWENGPVEMFQNGLLALAALGSVVMALLRRQHVQRYLWLGAALLWLLLLGRELSWGAVFVEPVFIDPLHGPFYSSRSLAYRPWVPVIGVALLALVLLLIACARPAGLLRYAWQRRAWLPWGMLAACFLYGVAATVAEGGQREASAWLMNAQLLEEVFETGAYYYLLRAQIWTFLRWLKP